MRCKLFTKSDVFLCINFLVFFVIAAWKSQLIGQKHIQSLRRASAGAWVGCTASQWGKLGGAMSGRYPPGHAWRCPCLPPETQPIDARHALHTPNYCPPKPTPSNSHPHRRTNPTHSAGDERAISTRAAQSPPPCTTRRPNHPVCHTRSIVP